MQNEIIAKFYCSETFSINDINYFVLNGNVTEGKVKIGQYVNFFCMNYNKILKLKITGIQFVDYTRNRRTKLDIAVECSNKEELKLLDEIKIANETGFVTNH
jgi:hypothetical protein